VNRSIYLRLSALALTLTTSVSAFATIHSHKSDSDAQIEASVRELLGTRVNLAPNAVDVQSIGGVVYLYGLVDTGREKWAAESIAAQTPGVARVVNSIAEIQ
jgi:osmotically-inducible protein OsmY